MSEITIPTAAPSEDEVEDGTSTWSLNHLASEAIEAAAAHVLWTRDPKGALWFGGHHPLTDVEATGYKIDAKVGFRERVDLGAGLVLALGFMGSGREIEAREGVTHYAIGVTADDSTEEKPDHFDIDPHGKVTLSSVRTITLLLFTREEVNTLFTHKRNRLGGISGHNLYIPLTDISAEHTVLGPELKAM